MAYARGNSAPHANLAVLDKLIAARHELAQASKIQYLIKNALIKNLFW